MYKISNNSVTYVYGSNFVLEEDVTVIAENATEYIINALKNPSSLVAPKTKIFEKGSRVYITDDNSVVSLVDNNIRYVVANPNGIKTTAGILTDAFDFELDYNIEIAVQDLPENMVKNFKISKPVAKSNIEIFEAAIVDLRDVFNSRITATSERYEIEELFGEIAEQSFDEFTEPFATIPVGTKLSVKEDKVSYNGEYIFNTYIVDFTKIKAV